MKKTYPRLVGDILTDMITRAGLAPDIKRSSAVSLWPEIVGPSIAAYTRRISMTDDGVMHVFIASAPLKEELGYARENLRQRINEALGEEIVTNIAIH